MQHLVTFLVAAAIAVAPSLTTTKRPTENLLAIKTATTAVAGFSNTELLNKYTHKISIEKGGKKVGSGSGIIISKNRILTAEHVAGLAGAELFLLMPDGVRKKCKLIKSDKNMDIALLSCDHGVRGPYVPIRGSMNNLGDRVTLCGFEYGTTKMLRDGNVEARLSRSPYYLKSPVNYYHFEVDALVSPGMSGGGALDSRGRLCGIIIEVRRDNGNSILVSAAGINDFMHNR